MITNKSDQNTFRVPKDVPSSQKKGVVPQQIPRLRYDRPKKLKSEHNQTPSSEPKNKKHHNCFPTPETPKTAKKLQPTLKMKSVSLVELPSEDTNKPKVLTQRKTVSRERVDELRTIKPENKDNIFQFTSARECELARKACLKFILHAWRARRTQTTKLQSQNTSLDKEVANLNIQMFCLKNLLESENNKVKVSMMELNHVRVRLEEALKSTKKLKESSNQLNSEKVHWSSSIVKMEERIQALQNELKKEANTSLQLSEKISIYEKSLSDSKENYSCIVNKLDVTETSLKAKTSDLNTLKNKCLDFQMKIEALISRNQELAREKERKEKQINEYVSNIKNFEVQLNNLQNIQKVQNSDVVKLRNECENAKMKIEDQERDIVCLQNTINLYELKDKELTNKCKTMAIRAFHHTLNLIPLPNFIPF